MGRRSATPLVAGGDRMTTTVILIRRAPGPAFIQNQGADDI